MLTTRNEQSGETGALVLAGGLTIEHAEELKHILLEALKNKSALHIDLQGVTKVDLFGLQVLCSAHLLAMETGKDMAFIGKRSGALEEAIVTAGYDRTAACSADKTCPWNEG